MPARQRTQRPPIDLAVELEQAVERNEFGLEYQPIIDLGSGSIAAVEALLRWRHPLMGTIAPADYLPLAEETGLIVPIGERVLDTATRQLRTWHLGFARMQSLRVNVNISTRQLADPGLLGHVRTVLQRSDLDAGSLTLELSPDSTDQVEAIEALADLGINLALEDFGHGSSLEVVRELPLSIVKLHPSFASHGCRQRLTTSPSPRDCCRSAARVTCAPSARVSRRATRHVASRSSAATWHRATSTPSRWARRASARCWRAAASRPRVRFASPHVITLAACPTTRGASSRCGAADLAPTIDAPDEVIDRGTSIGPLLVVPPSCACARGSSARSTPSSPTMGSRSR